MVNRYLALKSSRRAIMVIALPCFVYLMDLAPLRAQTDSIANERIPVKASQLEEHWKVDCSDSLGKAEDILNRTDSEINASEMLIDSITKCMHIYNTADTVHYTSKPDYRTLLEKLKRLSDR